MLQDGVLSFRSSYTSRFSIIYNWDTHACEDLGRIENITSGFPASCSQFFNEAVLNLYGIDVI